MTSPQPSSNDKFGGIYQVVATTPGLQYTVRAWNRTHFTGGLAWDHVARLGIDLGGGTGFEAPGVQWAEFDSAKDLWHPLEVAVTATSSSMTIYLESWRKWASGGDALTWFDDVQVVQGTPPPVNHAPTAVASANPTSGVAPLAVAFNGTGSTDPDGDALTYTWSFGDGAQGTGVTLSHAYAARGNYTATLTVNDGRGGSDGESVAITVSNRPPTAVAAASPTSGPAPLTVAFSGAGSSDPDGDALTYAWSFGDGMQGTGATVSHTYSTGGNYTATLSVDDGHGGSNSTGVAITAVAAAGPLVNGDFESSTPGGALGAGWIAFSSPGHMSAFAVVSDQVHGGSFAQRVTSPQPSSNDKFSGVYQVVATTAGVQYTVRAWNRTHFTGGNAWDHIARLGVDLAGGNNFESSSVQWLEFDSAKDLWHPLEAVVTATGGSMTIYLESWRKWASGGDSLTWFDDVQVGPNAPPPVEHPPTAVAVANPTSGTAPLTVAFNASGSTDPDGDPLTYAWSFGDGAQGSGVSVPHTYSTSGSYAATLTVDDGRGGTHSAEVVIVVDPPSGNRPPTAVISADPKSATIPFTVTLDASGSSDPDGDSLTYSWAFADGVKGSGPTMQRSFVDANGDMRETGGYLVTLTVSDGQGGTSHASVRVGVFPEGCPSALDFDAIRAQLASQGQGLAFVKIGFHTGGGGTFNGLGKWEHCLDAAGVPFAVKSVPNSRTAGMGDAAELRVRSGVPHAIVFRRCCDAFELPACAIASASTAWSSCTMDNAQQEAEAHWQRHLQAYSTGRPGLQATRLGGDDQRAMERQQHQKQRGVARQVLLLHGSPGAGGRLQLRRLWLDDGGAGVRGCSEPRPRPEPPVGRSGDAEVPAPRGPVPGPDRALAPRVRPQRSHDEGHLPRPRRPLREAVRALRRQRNREADRPDHGVRLARCPERALDAECGQHPLGGRSLRAAPAGEGRQHLGRWRSVAAHPGAHGVRTPELLRDPEAVRGRAYDGPRETDNRKQKRTTDQRGVWGGLQPPQNKEASPSCPHEGPP